MSLDSIRHAATPGKTIAPENDTFDSSASFVASGSSSRITPNESRRYVTPSNGVNVSESHVRDGGGAGDQFPGAGEQVVDHFRDATDMVATRGQLENSPNPDRESGIADDDATDAAVARPVAPAEMIRTTLRLFVDPGVVTEIRPFFGGSTRGQARCFADRDEAADYAARLDAEGSVNVYFTVNPLRPDIAPEASAKDADVTRRRWLVLDLDPERQAGVCATAAEKAAAGTRAAAVRAFLAGRGWPEPVEADSGNGRYLCYRIDLANDVTAQDLLRDVLRALAARFSDAAVKVDLSMFNASRIIRVLGTTNRKGQDTTERPHRRSTLLRIPRPITEVPTTMLEALAAEAPAPAAAPQAKAPAQIQANGRPTANGRPQARTDWIGTSTADDFRARATWQEILEPHAWQCTRTLPDGERQWTRPGKDGAAGISATTNHDGRDCFHVFSDKAAPFQVNASYSKFSTYAMLNHDGDEGAAAKDLYARGYGTRQPSKAIAGTTDVPTPPVEREAGTGEDADLDAELAQKHRTDLGNSERLIARFGSQVRYVETWGKWLVWDATRWALDVKDARILRLAKDTARLIHREVATLADRDQQKAHSAWAMKSQSRAVIASAIYLAKSDVLIRHDPLDRQPSLFNCPNGTIDLRSGEILPHDPKHLLTQLCPTRYDPAATCPLWDQTLELVFGGDRELIAYFRRLCGVFLDGSTCEQILPIFHGEGQNGKSTIVGCILEIMGTDYATKANRGLLVHTRRAEHPTELAALHGQRLVVASESGEGQHLNEDLVKELTGTEPIKARRMSEDFWQFDPTHTTVLVTNHEPVIVGIDFAIWRRIQKIPFNVIIPPDRVDKNMPAKLRAEYPGILAWAVRGGLEWRRDGLNPPAKVLEATEAYRREQDVIGRFVADECHVAHGLKAKASALYSRYKAWAAAAGEEPYTATTFGKRLGKRFTSTRQNDGNWYNNIMLRPNERDDLPFK